MGFIKISKYIIILLMTFVSGINASAVIIKQNGLRYEISLYVAIVGADENDPYTIETLDLSVPVVYEGTSYVVDRITSYAFKDVQSLKEIKFGDQKITIERGAFQNTMIEQIIVPESCEEIVFSMDAFFNCTELKYIEVNAEMMHLLPGYYAKGDKLYANKIVFNGKGEIYGFLDIYQTFKRTFNGDLDMNAPKNYTESESKDVAADFEATPTDMEIVWGTNPINIGYHGRTLLWFTGRELHFPRNVTVNSTGSRTVEAIYFEVGDDPGLEPGWVESCVFDHSPNIKDIYFKDPVPKEVYTQRMGRYVPEHTSETFMFEEGGGNFETITLHIPGSNQMSLFRNHVVWGNFKKIVTIDGAADDVTADSTGIGATRYYGLDGVPVNNPLPGNIYIVVDGNGARKVLL